MSLRTLVAFAQEHFGAFAGAGINVNPKEGLNTNTSPRPPLPTWIGQSDDRDVPLGVDYPWRIEGPINPQQPPPNVESFGADALAFWVPFHFYLERWGIFVRTSGVIYLAGILKGNVLVPGDER